MYYLISICFTCLKSKRDLNLINRQVLIKLLHCIEKEEDFIPLVSNQTKICNDCLKELNATLHFKTMCLNNIVQFKNYMEQLEQVSNNLAYKTMTVVLTDINKPKGDNSPIDLTFKQQTVFIKEEILDEEYFVNTRNNETQQNDSEFHEKELTKIDSIDVNRYKITDEPIDLRSAQIEEVFIKSEIKDENSESQNGNPIEKLKLMLHKEPLLNEVENPILGPAHCNTEEPSLTEENPIERPHCCSTCGKNFAFKSNLRTHMLVHSNRRPHSCPICMRTFKRKCILNQHMVIHSNKRPFSCPICMKSFNQKSSLNQHEFIHSKIRPFTCSVCTKSFSNKSNVLKHMLIHSNERPFSCTICLKSFTQKNTLNQHKLTHAEKRPFTCTICVKSFTQKGNFKKHMLIHNKSDDILNQPG